MLPSYALIILDLPRGFMHIHQYFVILCVIVCVSVLCVCVCVCVSMIGLPLKFIGIMVMGTIVGGMWLLGWRKGDMGRGGTPSPAFIIVHINCHQGQHISVHITIQIN